MDVGLIGLGLLGGSLASRLLAVGFPVRGYDLNADRCTELEQMSGRAARSPQAVAATCRRIILSLPNSAVVGEVVSDIGPQHEEGAIVIDTTTGDPEHAASLGPRLASRRIHYIEAEIGGLDAIVLCGG